MTEHAGQKVTIYRKSEYTGNIVKSEAKLHESGHRSYAQYPEAPYFIYTVKRKRTKKQWTGKSEPFALVLAGWENPDPDTLFGEMRATGTPGVAAASGRYTAFDPSWAEDFNTMMDPKIEAGEVTVVLDFRKKTEANRG